MSFARSLLFNLFFFLSTFVLTILAWTTSLGRPERRPSRVMAWARLWARIEIAAARIICGIRMEISGQENLPPGPCIVASRHESAFDILAWMVLAPATCFVLKRELTRIPLFGGMLLTVGMISVDRSGGANAMRSMLRDADRAKQEGRQIVIFPEGTRTDPDDHPPLQPGIVALASRTGLPVVPVMTDSGRCWGKRAFHKRPGTIHVRIQAPLPRPLGRDAQLTALHGAFGG